MLNSNKKDSPPQWLLRRDGITARQWRTKKRQELDAVIKAMEIYHLGCAYCPYPEDATFEDAYRTLKKLREALSVKNWAK